MPASHQPLCTPSPGQWGWLILLGATTVVANIMYWRVYRSCPGFVDPEQFPVDGMSVRATQVPHYSRGNGHRRGGGNQESWAGFFLCFFVMVGPRSNRYARAFPGLGWVACFTQ